MWNFCLIPQAYSGGVFSGVWSYDPANLNCGFGCWVVDVWVYWLIVLCVRYINLVLGNENKRHTTPYCKLHSWRPNKTSQIVPELCIIKFLNDRVSTVSDTLDEMPPVHNMSLCLAETRLHCGLHFLSKTGPDCRSFILWKLGFLASWTNACTWRHNTQTPVIAAPQGQEYPASRHNPH